MVIAPAIVALVLVFLGGGLAGDRFGVIGLWIVATVGFFFYVSSFGRYGATYSAFAGAVILLLWLYISSIAFLFGAELNGVVDRQGGEVTETQAQPQDGYGRDALTPRPAAPVA